MVIRRVRIGRGSGSGSIVVVVLALSGVACGLIAGIRDHEFRSAPAEDAAVSVPDTGPPLTCGRTEPPPPPVTATNGGDRTLILAFKSLSLTKEGAVPGADLDGVCTCDPTDPSIHRNQRSCIPPQKSSDPLACDHDGGIDNNFANLVELANLLYPSDAGEQRLAEQERKTIECGQENAIFIVNDYNGEADDKVVSISATRSLGIVEIADNDDRGFATGFEQCGTIRTRTGPPDSRLTYPARADGTDIWSVVDGFAGTDPQNPRPPFPVPAYVTNWTLVSDGRFQNFTIPIVFGSRAISLSTPLFTARIVPVDAELNPLPIEGKKVIGTPVGYRLADGVITGRLAATELVSALGALRETTTVEGKPTFFCENAAIFPFVADFICQARDINAVPGDTFTDAGCDAVSLAVGFTAVPAKMGKPAFEGEKTPCEAFKSCD